MKISANRVTCLTGESGAGKTSLLRLLNRMNEPDSGSVFYQDQLLDNLNLIEHRRKVTMLSQTPFTIPGTIEENLQLGLGLTDREKKSKAEFVKALDTVLLQKSLSDDAEILSGGEKQRLALARLLLLKPEVYLLDEETELKVMSRFLAEVKRGKGTVIMITHSKQLADTCAEKMIILKKTKEGDY
ncbi:ATP-binding cassette domain-containing protein [Peribacillus butanolivorans]|uniref:ATP-binding cassette domain-containing protein n=1 Tax=Peribacillus butanolivorans TaxID=421767 RepID=UPI00364F089E